MENPIVCCNLPNGQIPEEEFGIIENRMYPTKDNQKGFLAEGDKLKEILKADNEYLQTVGISYKQIVDRMNTLIGKYYRYFNNKKDFNTDLIEDKYRISHMGYISSRECPFQNKNLDPYYRGHIYGSTDIKIVNVLTGKSIEFNTLLVHMIGCHEFFESPRSYYRLEPKDIIDTLEIKPGVNYEPIYKISYQWCSISQSPMVPDIGDIHMLAKLALKVYQISDNIIGLLFPTTKFIYDIYGGDFLEIYRTAVKDGLSWSEIRKMIHSKINAVVARHGNEHLAYSNTDIDKEIAKEIVAIEKYRTTGCMENLGLHVFVIDRIPNGTYFVENSKCNIQHKFTVFEYKMVRYVS